MQPTLLKCYRIAAMFALSLATVTCVMAQASANYYTPSAIKGYSGSMSYIYLQDSVDVWLPDLFELDAKLVLDRISDNGGTTAPLTNHRLQYLDGIVNDQTKSRIEVHYTLTSNKVYVTKDDLYALGLKFRALRDDFYKSVEVPGLMRIYKAISTIGGDKIVIQKDGSLEKIENESSTMYGESDLLLNYFSSDWTKVLQEGTYTELDGGRQKVVGRVNDAEFIIVINTDGTFSDVTSQGQMPGGWTMKTVCYFDEWTTGSTVLLPGKMDWTTMMVANGMEVTLVDSHIRLLNLENRDFISQALSRNDPQ